MWLCVLIALSSLKATLISLIYPPSSTFGVLSPSLCLLPLPRLSPVAVAAAAVLDSSICPLTQPQ